MSHSRLTPAFQGRTPEHCRKSTYLRAGCLIRNELVASPANALLGGDIGYGLPFLPRCVTNPADGDNPLRREAKHSVANATYCHCHPLQQGQSPELVLPDAFVTPNNPTSPRPRMVKAMKNVQATAMIARRTLFWGAVFHPRHRFQGNEILLFRVGFNTGSLTH